MQDNQNNQFPPQNAFQPYTNGVQQTQNVAPPPINSQPQPPEPKKSLNMGILIGAIAIVIVAIVIAILVVVLNTNKQENPPKQDNNSYSDQNTNNSDNNDYQTEKEKKNSEKVLAKCNSAQNCIENLDNNEGITVEQYNAAIGFEGVFDSDANYSEYSKTYTWEFSNGDKLSATFTTYSKITIEVDYNYSAHLNTAVNLDGYDDIQDEIEHGITYDEFKAALGNVDGILVKRWGYGDDRDYLWVGSSAARYLRASVDEHNIVTFVTGVK